MTVKETGTATRRETLSWVSSAVLFAQVLAVPGPPCSFYSCASVSSREEANPRPLYTGYFAPSLSCCLLSHGWQRLSVPVLSGFTSTPHRPNPRHPPPHIHISRRSISACLVCSLPMDYVASGVSASSLFLSSPLEDQPHVGRPSTLFLCSV